MSKNIQKENFIIKSSEAWLICGKNLSKEKEKDNKESNKSKHNYP